MEGMNDPSGIRAGEWGEAWEGLLRWSVLLVSSFRRCEGSKITGLVHGRISFAFPCVTDHSVKVRTNDKQSKPNPDIKTTPSLIPNLSTIPTILHDLLPRIPNLLAPNTHPSYALTLPDLTLLLSPVPILPTPSLVSHLISVVLSLSPFRAPQDISYSRAEVKQRELHARANLAMAETVGWVMIGALRLGQSAKPVAADGGRRSHHLAERGPLDEEGEERLIAEEPRGVPNGRRPSSEDEVDREKTIEDLERRRGGSPPTTRRHRSSDVPDPIQERSSNQIRERSPTVQKTHRRQLDDDQDDDDEYDFDDEDALTEDEGILERAVRKGDETMRRGKDLIMEEAQDMVLLSENQDGWGMYVSMVAVVALALVLGMIG